MPSFMMGLDDKWSTNNFGHSLERYFSCSVIFINFPRFFFFNQRNLLIWMKLKSEIEECVCQQGTLFTSTTVISVQSHVRLNIPECLGCCFTAFTFSLKHLIMMATDTTKTS